MAVSGIPGGGGGGTDTTAPPVAAWLNPRGGEVLMGQVNLWAWDTVGSPAMDYAVFEYSYNGGAFVEIGRDLDGYSPVRGGKGAQAAGQGYSLDWDFSALPAGAYVLRATMVDSSGRSSSATVGVTLEPTPPVPSILSPANEDTICSPLTVVASIPDEDVSFMEAYRSEAAYTYRVGITATSQFTAGDANGNTTDGNLASNGEFGDYYSGPICAAMALQKWADRGVTIAMMQGSVTMTIPEAAEAVAAKCGTRQYLGTTDERLVAGLREYLAERFNVLTVSTQRDPDYLDIRTWVEEEERVVLLGLSGPSAIWVVVDGFNGFRRTDGGYDVRLVNPLNGAVELLPMRRNGTYSEVFFNSAWHRIDIMVALQSPTWTPARSLIGADLNGADGWSVDWTPSGLKEDSMYFLRVQVRDATGNRGASTLMLRYACTSVYARGDYDGDGFSDIGDLVQLIAYITNNGPAPAGGGRRADANCDTYVNIADIVFYLNYLFGTAPQPCY